jgi:AraC-like DNA-binding protein
MRTVAHPDNQGACTIASDSFLVSAWLRAIGGLTGSVASISYGRMPAPIAMHGIPTWATRWASSKRARGEVWTAIPGRVVIVNPDDAHDGGPATYDGGYSYRMIYVDGGVLATAIEEAAGRRVATPFFPCAVVCDAALADCLSRLHRILEHPEAKLERETLLITALVELARRHGKAAPHSNLRARAPRVVALAIDYLAENFSEDISLAELAALVGADRFHLLRAFRRCLGLPPHLYQTQLRLRHAKQLMLAARSAPWMLHLDRQRSYGRRPLVAQLPLRFQRRDPAARCQLLVHVGGEHFAVAMKFASCVVSPG